MIKKENIFKLYIKNILLLFIFLITFTGCNNKIEDSSCDTDCVNKYVSASLDLNKDIVIYTADVTKTATFINYEVDDVIVQLVTLKGTDDTVRVAFNTCQACNPAPNAYFIQEGDYLVCQTCGNKFHIDEVGDSSGGCNPTPVEEKEEKDGKIIIPKEYVSSFKEKFKSWEGKTEYN
jgi:uncharacterized membrane protein